MYLLLVYCLLLTFAPPLIVYKTTKLSEFSAFSFCVYSGLIYGGTQLVKILTLATLLPGEVEIFDVGQEVFKDLAGLLDFVGIQIALKYKPGLADLKVLGVAVGWSVAESVLNRLAPIWIGARGMEFDWLYVQQGIEANLSLLHNVGLTAAVWLWSRRSLDRRTSSIVVSALLANLFMTSALNYLRVVLRVSGWTLLAARGLFAVGVAAAAQQTFVRTKGE